jgi:hypothetical protein
VAFDVTDGRIPDRVAAWLEATFQMYVRRCDWMGPGCYELVYCLSDGDGGAENGEYFRWHGQGSPSIRDAIEACANDC